MGQTTIQHTRLDAFRYLIPKEQNPGMRVDGLVFANQYLMDNIIQDRSLEQVVNVAHLPGILKHSLAMPDIHWGYGFPIGGVAAFDATDGVVSPGGIGYDINCGVRFLRTNLRIQDVRPKLDELVNQLFRDIPTGVGAKGRLRVGTDEIDRVLIQGAKWAVENGYGDASDLQNTEEGGRMQGAMPQNVSSHAKERGAPQLGTLGSGNHFLEVQQVDQIFEPHTAQAYGITERGQITVMIHCGSRGLGYQVCDDYLLTMQTAVKKYGISLPDRQLACAPIQSHEGQTYLGAMRAAANYAWCNRQVIAHWTREAFERVFSANWQKLGIIQVYDVAHNIAKFETHSVEGKQRECLVHRKGATRSYPAGRRELPDLYRPVGQPVIIPGDMGRASYLLCGHPGSMEYSFGSTCHGAGRMLSRKAAMRQSKGRDLTQELKEQGVIVRAQSKETLAEEAPYAYKEISAVVDVAAGAQLSIKVARLKPIGVIKG